MKKRCSLCTWKFDAKKGEKRCPTCIQLAKEEKERNKPMPCLGCNKPLAQCTGQFGLCRELLTKEQATKELERLKEDFYGEHSSADEYGELIEDYLFGGMSLRHFKGSMNESIKQLERSLKGLKQLKVIADRLK